MPLARVVHPARIGAALSIGTLLTTVAACGSGSAADRDDAAQPAPQVTAGGLLPDAVGKCAVNKSSGMLAGRITALGTNPGSGWAAYVIDENRWFLSPDIVNVVDCAPAQAADAADQAARDTLIGKCAHNRSDDRLLGRIVFVGPPDRDFRGLPTHGVRMITVQYTPHFAETLGSTGEITIPNSATVRPCR